MTQQQVNEAVRGFLETCISAAREVVGKEEMRLGRRLTEAELRQVAEMVERQAKLAIAMKRAGA